MTTKEKTILATVFILALFVRLIISPYPGNIYDLKDNLNYIDESACAKGLWNIGNTWSPTGSLQENIGYYPPMLLFHSPIVNLGQTLVNKIYGKDKYRIYVIKSVRLRLISIIYDILIGLILFGALSKYVNFRAAVIASSFYLFNPGTILNSAVWQFDSMPSFYILLTIITIGISFKRKGVLYPILIGVSFALALGSKLQAGIIAPVLLLYCFDCRGLKKFLGMTIGFIIANIIIYLPFLLNYNLSYITGVLSIINNSISVTQTNTFNFWGLFFQMPVTNRILGLNLKLIGELFYIIIFSWIFICLYHRRMFLSDNKVHYKQIYIIASIISVIPFMILTSMKERYLAYSIPLIVLAGFLDKKMFIFMLVFLFSYAVNLILVMYALWNNYEGYQGAQSFVSHNLSRTFCSLLDTITLFWILLKLPQILRNENDAQKLVP